jgi:hypothetical protein
VRAVADHQTVVVRGVLFVYAAGAQLGAQAQAAQLRARAGQRRSGLGGAGWRVAAAECRLGAGRWRVAAWRGGGPGRELRVSRFTALGFFSLLHGPKTQHVKL